MTRKAPVVQVDKRGRAPRTMAHVLRASDARAEAGAAARPWRIVDSLAGGRPYIAVDYPDQRAAALALADLLQPYPPGDPWRRRIRIAPAVGELAQHKGFGTLSRTADQRSEQGRIARAAREGKRAESRRSTLGRGAP